MTSSSERDPLIEMIESALHVVRELDVRMSGSDRIVPLTPMERLVLQHIDRHSGISLQALADQVNLQTSNASAAVKRLVELGLLVRGRHPEDARRAALFLTPKAREGIEHIHREWRRLLSGAGLDEAEIDTGARVMRSLDVWLADH